MYIYIYVKGQFKIHKLYALSQNQLPSQILRKTDGNPTKLKPFAVLASNGARALAVMNRMPDINRP